ncbi:MULTISPECIES: helix-turn-helix transcriptional regulator [unclassified Micromonospora]|uniref:helix-turn-helix transcriptional regulator n=1 Tax=unclassified Micromonospora TaxID=2617518 RepID=UPI0033310941
MRAPTDLHPDDLAYRIGLRDLLIARRVELDYSQTQLADVMGVPQSTVARFEVGQPWRVERTQDIAYALRLRVVMYPHNLPGGPYEVADVDPRMPAQQQHLVDRQNLVRALVDAREACHVTQTALAASLGIHVNVLGRFETNTTGRLMLANCQRYLRALGGELWIGADALDPDGSVLSPLLALTGSTAA